MEATDWRFLPYPGGLLDQPEALLDDLFKIRLAAERVKERLRENAG